MSRSRIFTACLVAVLGGALFRHDARSSAQSGIEVRTEQWAALGLDVHELMLENGFRILLVEDHRLPRIAASLWYRFGGLQEHHGEHGAAHFLEHSIHQGTTTVGINDWEADRKLLRAIHDSEQELLAERNAERNRLTRPFGSMAGRRARGHCQGREGGGRDVCVSRQDGDGNHRPDRRHPKVPASSLAGCAG